MSLTRQLQRLPRMLPAPFGGSRAGAAALAFADVAVDARIDQLRRALRRGERSPQMPATQPAGGQLPGGVWNSPFGRLHRVLSETVLPDDRYHSAGQGLQAAVRILARNAELPPLDLRNALFLDTETTGLGCGAGRLAFLVGVASMTATRAQGGGGLQVEQIVLERPGEEGPMLHWLADRLAMASCLVTFNGKSYDWPLLRTRFVMQRLPLPSLPPHLDLLHTSRAMFRRRLPRLRLVDLETQVLNRQRIHDLPGRDVPARYARYLQEGNPGLLCDVIEHNRVDLVSLEALLAELVRRLCEPQYSADRRDQLSVAHMAWRLGNGSVTRSFAEAVLRDCDDEPLRHEAQQLLRRIERRRVAPTAIGDDLSDHSRLVGSAGERAHREETECVG